SAISKSFANQSRSFACIQVRWVLPTRRTFLFHDVEPLPRPDWSVRFELHLPGHNCHHRLTNNLATMKRRVSALRTKLVRINAPARGRINNRHIGIVSRLQRALSDIQYLARSNRELLNELRPGKRPFVDQRCDANR